MSTSVRKILPGAAALVASLQLSAQTPSAPPQTAAEAPAVYSSAFEGYRPFEAGEVHDWRKSNDTVREIGGWRAYAREIAEGSQSAGQAAAGAQPPSQSVAPAGPQGSTPPPAAQPKAADSHQGHHK